jgi:hypothetical protein
MEEKSEKSEGSFTAPVAQESLDRAIDAVVSIIIETLLSKSKQKFAEAARLCNIGQSLMRTQAKKIEDFALLEVNRANENVDENEAPGPAPMNLNRNYHVNAHEPDERAIRRDFMLTFGQNGQLAAETQRATIATQEATELHSLLDLVNKGPATRNPVIVRRIQLLIDRMEARNGTGADLVPPDVSRGHQVGEGGPQEDPAPGVRVDANGALGHGEVTFVCREEDVGPPDVVG